MCGCEGGNHVTISLSSAQSDGSGASASNREPEKAGGAPAKSQSCERTVGRANAGLRRLDDETMDASDGWAGAGAADGEAVDDDDDKGPAAPVDDDDDEGDGAAVFELPPVLSDCGTADGLAWGAAAPALSPRLTMAAATSGLADGAASRSTLLGRDEANSREAAGGRQLVARPPNLETNICARAAAFWGLWESPGAATGGWSCPETEGEGKRVGRMGACAGRAGGAAAGGAGGLAGGGPGHLFLSVFRNRPLRQALSASDYDLSRTRRRAACTERGA